MSIMIIMYRICAFAICTYCAGTGTEIKDFLYIKNVDVTKAVNGVAIFTITKWKDFHGYAYESSSSVAVPHNLDADPNPTFHFDADPDPAPSQRIKVMKIFDHWHKDSPRFHFDPASLHCERPRPSIAPFFWAFIAPEC